MPIDETLFAGSTVRLFGTNFEGLQLNVDGGAPAGAPAAFRAVHETPAEPAGQAASAPRLARIYGFSYQGSYYKLPEPTVLIVYGEGAPVIPPVEGAAPTFPGVEFNGLTFAAGVLMWEQDRSDYSVRIDITPGWLSDVLLDPGMSDGANMTTGQLPDTDARNALVGRAGMVGRAGLVGRAGMVGRGG